MKKPLIIALAVVVFLLAVWLIGSVTHTLEFYTISTTSNQPAYRPGDVVIASNLVKPARNKFIVFKTKDKREWIFRCIGMPGDIIEIKQTALYVNNQLQDEPFAANEYFIHNTDLKKIAGLVAKNKDVVKPMAGDSLSVITLTRPEVKAYQVKLALCSLSPGSINPNLFLDFRRWMYNEDNLGQIVVPKNAYFVLGDDRHNAYDSRFSGYVNAEDVISTVIN
ncbi:signal peptidase I [Mucilaginibacter sp. UYCu711]|uniref:signal peptidase I n=1 Tax=Mucilaginibacter sp. UYCu711 TaxID=3156339 RepID=UPI003D190D76